MTTIDLDELRQWVGREQSIEDPLQAYPARALAAALDHSTVPVLGDRLPASWHWLYFLETPARALTAVDGHARKGGFLPPIELPRRMWAGGALKVNQQLQLGSPATKRSCVRSIDHKSGKSGELVFVVLDHEITQAGKTCIQEEQTLVYRAMPTGRVPLPPGEPVTSAADWTASFYPDPVALFRFSALTFNSHRIHYDRDYATRQEFYAGLVVHAPLLATLLLDLLAREMPNDSLRAFRFRAVRPTFDLGPVQLSGKREGHHVNLWSTDSENAIAMSAIAELDSP